MVSHTKQEHDLRVEAMNPSDKVVCIDDGPCRCCGEPIVGIIKGQLYTVESVFQQTVPRFGSCWFLVLVGINASPGHDRGIISNRFRLLEEVKMLVSAVSKQKAYEPTLLP